MVVTERMLNLGWFDREGGQVQAFYNVEKPDEIGPDWSVRFQLQLFFPR